MMRLALLLMLFLASCLPCFAGANSLHLLDRFGPDGIPFTQDDPLAVGAFASEFRLAAMGGDACSEEEQMPGHTSVKVKDKDQQGIVGAHGYSQQHPPFDVTGRSRELDDHGLVPQVTKMPFDYTVWLAAVNLEDGNISRMRVFPDDLVWGPLDGVDSGREWREGAAGLEDVWPSGSTKDLHLDAFGMSYRDIKGKGGLAMGISKDTWKKIGLSGIELDMAVQQIFLESFVLEMMNLENNAAALSGNYTMDVAGLQLFLGFDGMPDTPIIDLDSPVLLGVDWPGSGKCSAGLRDVFVRLGDPVNPQYPFSGTPSEYFAEKRIPIIIPEVKFTGAIKPPFVDDPIDCQDIYDGLMESRNTGVIGDILAFFNDPPGPIPGIDIEKLVIKAILSSSGRIKSRLDYLDTLASTLQPKEYSSVTEYSGLAGPLNGKPLENSDQGDAYKTPFDRIALGTLRELGQFNPKEWGPWLGVGDPPVLKQIRGLHRLQKDGNSVVGQDEFEKAAGGQLVTVEDRLKDRSGWRYNGGATYLTKSAMLFGNSVGAKNQPSVMFRNNPDLQFEHNPLKEFSEDARKQLPDLLRHFARWWIHPRLDLIDPYRFQEVQRNASWTSLDILFDHGNDPATKSLTLDWPPPNYHFGRSQILAFRAGSGGVPQTNPSPSATAPPYNVSTKEALTLQGLISVDPVGGTLSWTGVRTSAGGGVNKIGTSRSGGMGWDDIIPIQNQDLIPGKNSTDLRWLTGGVNHHADADSIFEWRWDLDGDGTTDSVHLQQMAKVGAYATLFGYQSTGEGKNRGRTGFSLVPTTDPAREALQKLSE